jgi:hypothetical protein
MEIMNIPPEKYFYVSDGSVIKSLNELPDALRRMHPDTFAYHANSEKNDFANWTKEVFNHSRLAKKLKVAKDKEAMAKKVFIEIFT